MREILKTLALTLSILLLSSLAHAKTCEKKQKSISCAKVAKAQRTQFCWSGKLDNAKKERICKSKKVAAKKIKAKKRSKKKKS